MPVLTPADLDDVLDAAREHALFDVRETGEAHRGHIPGACFLPRRHIEMRAADLVPRRDTPIVLYDSGQPNDSRAARGAHTFARLGWTRLRVLEGGVRLWNASARPLAQGSNVPGKRFGEEVQASDEVPRISATELERWRDTGRAHLVCDIRTPEEYARARIPGARGAFGTELALLAGDLRARGGPVVVHCSGRTRSIIACRSLRLLGVQAYALENGTMGWQLAGYALEHGAGAGPLEPTAQSRASGEADARRLALDAGARLLGAPQLADWLRERAAGRANVYLIDVRQVAAYVRGHIPGALAVPGGLAIQRADDFVPVRAARVVFVDDDEARAGLAAYWFRRMGFAEVYLLEGGLGVWTTVGGALEQGRGRARPLGWDEAHALATQVAAPQMQALAASGSVRIVSVDTSAQFSKGHPAGAVWIRYGELEDRVAAMPRGAGSRIVLACRDGVLSTLAAANLAREAVEGVRVLDGGLAAWQAAGLPVEHGLPDGCADDLVVQPYDAGPDAMRRYLEWEQALTVRQAGTVPG